jgi:hypothetical protein
MQPVDYKASGKHEQFPSPLFKVVFIPVENGHRLPVSNHGDKKRILGDEPTKVRRFNYVISRRSQIIRALPLILVHFRRVDLQQSAPLQVPGVSLYKGPQQ